MWELPVGSLWSIAHAKPIVVIDVFLLNRQVDEPNLLWRRGRNCSLFVGRRRLFGALLEGRVVEASNSSPLPL